jgi:hypothetical protein
MNTEIDSKIKELKDMENDLLVRINGTLPDLSIIGGEEKSEITVCRTDAAGGMREKR